MAPGKDRYESKSSKNDASRRFEIVVGTYEKILKFKGHPDQRLMIMQLEIGNDHILTRSEYNSSGYSLLGASYENFCSVSAVGRISF